MNLQTLFFKAFGSRPRPLTSQIIRPDVSHHEGDGLFELLKAKTPAELTDDDLRTVVESNLWMLTPEAFLYFLPAFLHASLQTYASVSVFASELIGALTEPSRADTVEALDHLAAHQAELALPHDMSELLRKQQLEWFDSGTPTAIFHERFDNLTQAEGAAILAFFDAFQRAYGENFPFDELKTAVDRYWFRYRAS
jgi:hypothetical protein